jgi:hypothetical protein
MDHAPGVAEITQAWRGHCDILVVLVIGVLVLTVLLGSQPPL